MKSKHPFFTGFVFALAFTFFSCLRAYTAQFQLGTTNLLEPASFFSGFGEDTIEIAANPTNANWTITGNIPWLAGTPPSSGVGSSIVTFIFTNNAGATRTGTLTIAGQPVTITQAGSNFVAAPEPATVVTTSGMIYPFAVALDNAGNAYIADQGALAIFEWVKTNNSVTTLLQGVTALGVAVDGQGNVYFSQGNAIEERAAANGHVTALVSSGLSGVYGIAVDGAGNVYIADTGHNAIKEWVAASNNVVSLVSTGLNQPEGVAVDIMGNVYIGDTGNYMLKEWSPTNASVTVLTSYISTNGDFPPFNLAVDGSGNVYSASAQNIEKFSRGATLLNRLSVVASAGIEPYGVAVDQAGNVFIADSPNGALRELPHAFLVPATSSEPYIAGSDTLTAAVLPTNALQFAPFIPASDQSWLTITGVTNDVISFSFTTNTMGAQHTAHINLLGYPVVVSQSAVILGTTNLLEGPATGTDSVSLVVPPRLMPLTASANADWLHVAPIYRPATNGTNVVFTFDANPGTTRTGTINIGNQMFVVTQAGASYVAAPAPLTALVPHGIGFSFPGNLVLDDAGDVYIADTYHHAIREWIRASNSLTTVISGLGQPTGLALDNVDDLLFFSDTLSNAVYVCALPNPRVFPIITSGLSSPASIAIDSSDNVYIIDNYNEDLKRWNISDGSISLLASGFETLQGITLDTAGDVYFCNAYYGNIEEWVAATGNVITNVSGLLDPTSVAVDGSGNIYIADGGTLEKWTAATGNLTTLISPGAIYPVGVFLDGADNLYIADYNGAVEELPRAFVPASQSESYFAGSDALSVLPASVNLLPPFAPTSDQSWLTITNTTGGIINFAFTSNIGTSSPRTAHVNVLGESVSVIQTNSAVTPPKLGHVSWLRIASSYFIQFSFTNTPGTTFTVLGTTNLALPLANWVNVGTVSNISPGIYQFTTQPLTNSQEFYKVVWP